MVAACADKLVHKAKLMNKKVRSAEDKDANTANAFLNGMPKGSYFRGISLDFAHKGVALALLPKAAFWAVAWYKYRVIAHRP